MSPTRRIVVRFALALLWLLTAAAFALLVLIEVDATNGSADDIAGAPLLLVLLIVGTPAAILTRHEFPSRGPR